MPRKKILENATRVIVNITGDDIEYLSNNRINRSKFVRSAIKAYKEGKFEI